MIKVILTLLGQRPFFELGATKNNTTISIFQSINLRGDRVGGATANHWSAGGKAANQKDVVRGKLLVAEAEGASEE
jgi:hypothetical protein